MKKGEKNQGKKLLPDFYAETDLFPAAVSCSRGNAYGMPIPFFFARTMPEFETLAHFFRELDHLSFLLDTRDGV